jgi:hypothetical protein
MAQHTPYPSTPSFDNFKRQYLRALTYEGDVDLQEQIYTKPPRSGIFVGTIKLHGTNASIVYTNGDKHRPQFQARTWVIEEGKDNQGTRALLSKAPLHGLVDEILRIHKSDTFEEIYIVGEVAGKGIQKGMAITKLDPFFAIFNLRINGNWVDIRSYKSVALPQHRIFNIAQYPVFSIAIDFRQDTEEVLAQMEKWTMDVYNECPFGAAFTDTAGKKVSGVGEGIVWTLVESTDEERPLKRDVLWNFKTKGEQFSTVSKPKTGPTAARVPVGPTKSQQAAVQFADYVLTERRFEQGLEYLLLEQSRKGVPESEQNALDPKLTGAFLKWVADDAIKEEKYKMTELEANEKDVRKEIGMRARKWFVRKGKDASNTLKLVEE